MGPGQAIGKKLNVWGLTGGIGSGKSTVAKIFESEGCPIIDADQIAKKLRAPGGRAEAQINQVFGTTDPAKLKSIVFSDANKRSELEAILHPLIKEESDLAFQKADKDRADPKLPIIYEASQIIEAKRAQEFQGIIVIEATEEKRLEWLNRQRGLDSKQSQAIMAHQMSDKERIKHADIIIENKSTTEALAQKVLQAIDIIKKKAKD